jgi:uncharacterized protein (UPF0332 family)
MAYAFNPINFLALAEALADADADETKLRTAINRAYYAVFLLARARTGATEVEEGTHSAVRRLLTQRGYREVAQRLAKLYDYRVEADYDLSPATSEQNWTETWQEAHILARDPENRISGIRAGRLPKNFR